jgi:hypothetical protein
MGSRDIALGLPNWTFFSSDPGGKTVAVLRSFVAPAKAVRRRAVCLFGSGWK